MFNWKKYGNIFCPSNNFPWMVSHAANPFPVAINSDTIRVYFTSRDANNRSHICFVDLDGHTFNVIDTCKEPVVAPGDPGYFDDSGAAMGWFIRHSGKEYIYYLGWNLKVTVPWQNSIGLAIADEGTNKYHKYSRAPIMDRSNEDPFSISYPSILFEDQKFKMWYGSNLSWGDSQEKMSHVIKYAESTDGITWKRTNQVCIDLIHVNEYAISKPCVLKIKEVYHMWYSFRANGSTTGYRIGYAESTDGTTWKRKDDLAGIEVSAAGWDSEMICYPTVFFHRGKLHMLYNGNGYGKTGFGLAINEN